MAGEPESKNPLDDDAQDPPLPSEVRTVILTEHRHIRQLLNDVERAAKQVKAEPSPEGWGELRERGITLLGRMLNHISLENRMLAPALRDTDSYGPLRARTLIEDHAQQRGSLEANLMLLDSPGAPPSEVADRMLELVQFIREDMQHEERDLLDPNLLRDDIIVTDSPVG